MAIKYGLNLDKILAKFSFSKNLIVDFSKQFHEKNLFSFLSKNWKKFYEVFEIKKILKIGNF